MPTRMMLLFVVGALTCSAPRALADPGSGGTQSRNPLINATSGTTANTAVDHLRNWFRAAGRLAGFKEPTLKSYQTQEAATVVFDLVGRRLARGESYDLRDVPVVFEPTTNNMSEEYSRGAAFAKMKELLDRTIAAREAGITDGVFILAHNFILSADENGQRMTQLFIRARKAGVPIMFSYDQAGTLLYGGLTGSVVKQMKEAGVPIISNPSLSGATMDHRKLYFFGTGDGHVVALCGGQGWSVQYSGKDWESLPALPDGKGCLLYGRSESEPWLDHMRLIDGEAALQGALNFLARFVAKIDPAEIHTLLGSSRNQGQEAIGALLQRIFLPELKSAGQQMAVILNNTSWGNRPITEAWYRNLSDPGVTQIRIAMPYITDPVFRGKLRQAVRDAKDLFILIPGQSDNFLAQIGTQYLFRDLIRLHQSMIKEGKRTGQLQLKEWRSARGEPLHIHMKYGIFSRAAKPQEDTIVDGSYNATGLEARVGEVNADIAIQGHDAAAEAAMVFDGYMRAARDSAPSYLRALGGLLTVVILRPAL